MKTLLLKEFTINWRSFRFPALLLVFLFFALLDPVTTRYMNEIMAYFTDFELALPVPVPETAFFSYLSSVSQIGILVLIFTTMGIVAKEKENGVAAWMLSKPVGRRRYLAAKVINLYALIIVGLGATSAIAYVYTWSLLGQVPAKSAAWAVACIIVYTLFIASLTFILSTLMKTPLQAGGLTVLLFFISGLLQLVVANSAVRKFYPNTLLAEMGNLLQGVTGPSDIALPLASTLCLSLLLVYLAGRRFTATEL